MEPGTRRLRSERWYDDSGVNGFLQRSAHRVQGLREQDYQRPVIGIANNTSDFNRCHSHFGSMVTALKESIIAAGGLPREFNSISMGADLAYPLGMTFMHRNLLAMEIEQTAALHGVDGLVMLGACDETIPGLLMAAASINLPTVILPGGPSFTGFWKGREVGSGYDCHRAFEARSRGELTDEDLSVLESSLERTAGHCTTMGTAGTMVTIAEALGMAPAGSSAIPAVDSRRIAMTRDVGDCIMRAVREDLRPLDVMTTKAFENAARTMAAIDGAANGVIHLLAVAGRLDVAFELQDFDRLSADTPVLLNLRPSGKFYYNDFFNAGGVPALLNAMGELIHRDCVTVTGRTIGEEVADATIQDHRVIGTLARPVGEPRGISVLHGNLAPDGAIMRAGVASAELLEHRGRAVVFQSKEEQDAELYEPDFDIRPGDVVVVLNGGPKGSAGMPEYGRIQVPNKLLLQGVTDMVRVTDGRVGGTVSGTAVLQIAPEAADGGPIGLVQTGDMIVLDHPRRRLEVELSDEELAARRARRDAEPRPAGPARGFAKLYVDSVTQADTGCDFDFLRRTRAVPTTVTES